MNEFKVTHILTVSNPNKKTFPVMLHEGALFKRSEWDGCESADYTYHEDEETFWVEFQGNSINFELVDVEEEEDEDEMDDLAMLTMVLDEAGWHSKSHEIKEILKALIDGEHICRLDSGSSGEDDLLIGTAHEVDVDVCAHFEIEEIPEDWKITDVTDHIKSRMW